MYFFKFKILLKALVQNLLVEVRGPLVVHTCLHLPVNAFLMF